MKTFFTRIGDFFFAPRSALSFGLMRILWAAATFGVFVSQAPDIVRYYSDSGFFPRSIEHILVRWQDHYTLLDIVGDPHGVLLLYGTLLLSCVLMLLGVVPRLTTIVTVLLSFSFQERNPLPIAGGDTILRVTGFLLMISPGIQALSLSRFLQDRSAYLRTGKRLPALTMPTWPWRLLLWQTIVLYVTAAWSKLLGVMWPRGTAVAISLQHPHFARFHGWMADMLSTVSPAIDYASIVFECSWILLLIPRPLLGRFGRSKPLLLRTLLVVGLCFHVGIDATLLVGSFLPAMLALLAGLMDKDDFLALRWLFNAPKRKPITVLYDGHCGFCRKSVFFLLACDWLGRLRLVDFRDATARKKAAPDLAFAALNRALHIRLSDGRTYQAFRAFRVLALHLPPVWPFVPFLYLPGAVMIGEWVYADIAARRKTCTHESCGI